MNEIWTSDIAVEHASEAWRTAAGERSEVELLTPGGGYDVGLLWRPGSALKTAEVELRGVEWEGGEDGVVSVRIGRPNEWAANGVLRLELEWRDGVATATLIWEDGRDQVTLREHRLLPKPGATESPSRFDEVQLAIDERPPSAWRWSFDNLGSARGMIATEVRYRPYAVTPQEIAVAVGGAVRVESWHARIGARPAPIVAFGDSQIHGARTLEQLAKLGLPAHVNAGQAGGDTTGGLARLHSDLLALRPSHVLLWLGSNDLGYARARGEDPATAIDGALDHLGELIQEAWDASITPVVIGALPRGGEAVMRDYNARLAALAGRLGATFYDPYEVLHRRNDKQDIRYSDGLHPNDAGAEKLAAWLADKGIIEALGGTRKR